MLETTLEQIGLEQKESAVYLAMLALGQSHVSKIAVHAKVNRSTVYLVLNSLVEKGLASRVIGKKSEYSPLHPQKLLALEKAKIANLEFAMPSLLGLASQAEQKPSIRFFTGKEGVVSVYEESLLVAHGTEILALGHAQTVELKVPKFREWYIKRRVKLGIKMRAITPATPGGLAVGGRDKLELRETRFLLPEQFQEQVEINIYQNKVAMVSLAENELIGMIMESRVFAAAYKSIFELLWAHSRKSK